MRTDMHKVLVEEGRRGGISKMGRRANLPEDLLPAKEGMRRPHLHRKCFGEHLGPLKRWLRSNVGRPWNLVYSEASWVMKPVSVVRSHIRFHMMEMVQVHTYMQDGQVWAISSHGIPFQIRPNPKYTVWPGFFVHPRTGLLLEGDLTGGSRYSRFSLPRPPAYERRWMDATWVLMKINGRWRHCDVAEFPRERVYPDKGFRFDCVLEKEINAHEAAEVYGKAAYCASMTPLTRSELRQNQLSNEQA